MARIRLGNQGSLFGDEGATPIEIKARHVGAPHGHKDKSGRYWYQRMAEDVEALPDGVREACLVMLLVWPADRLEAVRKIINRWNRAQHLERDNFSEHMGF